MMARVSIQWGTNEKTLARSVPARRPRPDGRYDLSRPGSHAGLTMALEQQSARRPTFLAAAGDHGGEREPTARSLPGADRRTDHVPRRTRGRRRGDLYQHGAPDS